MFISDEVPVGAPVDQARDRLFAQVDHDGLNAAAAGAFADLEKFPGPSGPAARCLGLTVHTLPSYRSGPVTVVPLRLYTSSASDDRFPTMDANLELQQAEQGTSRLALTGSCRAATAEPFTGREQEDARTIIRHFLGRLAESLTAVHVVR